MRPAPFPSVGTLVPYLECSFYFAFVSCVSCVECVECVCFLCNCVDAFACVQRPALVVALIAFRVSYSSLYLRCRVSLCTAYCFCCRCNRLFVFARTTRTSLWYPIISPRRISFSPHYVLYVHSVSDVVSPPPFRRRVPLFFSRNKNFFP